jgi:hypothetical protein
MKEKKKTDSNQPDMSGASFEYADQILSWNLEEGSWYTAEIIGEQLAYQKLLTGTAQYGLLMNASNNVVINLECMERLINQEDANRKAIAIVTGENLATFLMVSFFINTNCFQRKIGLFRTEDMARAWLNERVSQEG